MIEIGIHCNFFIDLPIRLRTCRSNGFFYKTKFARSKNLSRPPIWFEVLEYLILNLALYSLLYSFLRPS